MKRIKVFISSVQSEFSTERETLYRHLETDPFLKVYFEPILFEKMPASCKSAEELYLEGVKSADVFVILLGNEYGTINSAGISATELEFDTAFDATMHPNATLSEIDTELVYNFLDIAGSRRNFPFRRGSSIKKVLTHLNLLSENEKIGNSALLAFTSNPQRYFPTAIVKCAHFHGYNVEKPIPNHQIFKGTVFEQISEAVDFVLAKIDVSVGTRDKSIQAPIAYEIPRAVITEVIVNAVAHRDYCSNGSVEVWLFKDRLEVKNPGHLPKELSLEKLEHDHGSYPYNPNLAEILYQTGLIERFGTGTAEIFRLTEHLGLQKPDFHSNEGFKVIIWRKSHNQDVKSGFTAHDTAHDTVHDTAHDALSEIVFLSLSELTDRVVLILKNEMSREELMDKLDLKHRQNFALNYLEPSLKLGFVEMTIPSKPKSKLQKYKLTSKGLKLQKKLKNEYKSNQEI